MVLKCIGLIGGNTTRTKAYLQILFKNNIYINKCYIMSDSEVTLEKEAAEYNKKNIGLMEQKYFVAEEPILYTLNENKVDYEIIQTEDINSLIMLDKIRTLNEDFLIYSGFGGQILKEDLFKLGKKYIHVHAGILPQYRGSTTVYYSMINENMCGASAIFLNPKIDEGDIVASAAYPLPIDGANIDYIYEPWVRAKVLLKALEEFADKKKFYPIKQSCENQNIYYIIHPVLKHIALLQK